MFAYLDLWSYNGALERIDHEPYADVAKRRNGKQVPQPPLSEDRNFRRPSPRCCLSSSDQAKGFEVLPKRRIVERTFARLKRCRKLAKDFENLTRTALTFVKRASIQLMLRQLCNPA